MPKFVKKPIPYEAEQLEDFLTVDTPAGQVKANPGDWLLTGPTGEKSVCKTEVFLSTYQPHDDAGRGLWWKVFGKK